jgi:predicted MPP superfamily phosphohydrolase
MSILPFFLFLTLVIAGHYFAYLLLINAFSKLKSRRVLVILALSLVTVLFISSLILLYRFQNNFLMPAYLTLAVSFGLLTQLMIFGFLFFARKMILNFCPFAKRNCILPDPKSAARLMLIFAASLFLLGTYNAFFPKVKTITLKAFSEEIKGKSFVHLSDLHLGAVYRPSWQKMISQKVNALEADFVIISGDLFDGSDSSLSEFVAPLSSFSKTTIFVPGNHDSYIFGAEVEETVKKAGLIYLVDEAFELPDFEVVGFNYVSNKESDMRREIEGLKEEKLKYRIVINHVPVDQAEANALGADLMLMGHAHRGQIFPFSLATRLIYGHYAHGLSNYNDMTTYTSAGTGTWGPPLRTLFPGEIILFKFE